MPDPQPAGALPAYVDYPSVQTLPGPIAFTNVRMSAFYLAADGKTVDNLVGYPGIWRGTLDAKARTINFEMYRAAIGAITRVTAEGELLPHCG